MDAKGEIIENQFIFGRTSLQIVILLRSNASKCMYKNDKFKAKPLESKVCAGYYARSAIQ